MKTGGQTFFLSRRFRVLCVYYVGVLEEGGRVMVGWGGGVSSDGGGRGEGGEGRRGREDFDKGGLAGGGGKKKIRLYICKQLGGWNCLSRKHKGLTCSLGLLP